MSQYSPGIGFFIGAILVCAMVAYIDKNMGLLALLALWDSISDWEEEQKQIEKEKDDHLRQLIRQELNKK
jgi:hypothetical protein